MHACVQAIFVIGIIRREPDSKDGYVYPPGPQAKELPNPFFLKKNCCHCFHISEYLQYIKNMTLEITTMIKTPFLL